MSAELTTSHVPCPGCGCVCDDLTIQQHGDELRAIEPYCPLAERWFRRHWQSSAECAWIDGQAVPLDAAIERAATILDRADYPLIYGLSRSATSGQRAAVALAERVGAVLDTTASLCHGPSIMAVQEVGEITSTLGEIRNRADLVVFWGCNPAETHPRHAERYSVHAAGKQVPLGRANRRVVLVGDERYVRSWRTDDPGTPPDRIVALPPGTDFEALLQLHAALINPAAIDLPAELAELLQWMTSCRYGVVFFGLGLAKSNMSPLGERSESGHNDVAALLKLVTDLNAHTRFTARRMRIQGDVSGADNVLCWQTGYPFGVDFSRGFPRYNPGEFTTNELLERGDVDACLIIGAETLRHLSPRAQTHLARIPIVQVDYPAAECPWSPQVRITTAVHGIHLGGTIYRMDNVPLPLRPLTHSTLPTDEQVLLALAARLERLA